MEEVLQIVNTLVYDGEARYYASVEAEGMAGRGGVVWAVFRSGRLRAPLFFVCF